ncbi:DUF5615 family PIN-like protein [Candidatus Wolfebacteria bacterium]|nr:DUF5615 family PIN-like protein [Candidatus Wolfebacteria bacterium]
MSKARFLLDANLSPETANFLRSLGFDVKSLIEERLGDLHDWAVAEMAKKEKRILLTLDLDFGEMYYFAAKKTFGVIVLRLEDQRVQIVNKILSRFLEMYGAELERRGKNLFILRETEVRVVD